MTASPNSELPRGEGNGDRKNDNADGGSSIPPPAESGSNDNNNNNKNNDDNNENGKKEDSSLSPQKNLRPELVSDSRSRRSRRMSSTRGSFVTSIRSLDASTPMSRKDRVQAEVKNFWKGLTTGNEDQPNNSDRTANAGDGDGGGGDQPQNKKKDGDHHHHFASSAGGEGEERPSQSSNNNNESSSRTDINSGGGVKAVQYRLNSTKKKKDIVGRGLGRRMGSAAVMGSAAAAAAKNTFTVGLHPNMLLAGLLHWMFRVNLLLLFLVFLLMFFGLIVLFTGFIVWAGHMEPDCVRIGGLPFATDHMAFADAFALSWTTLSTVGYGSSYPALSHENDSATDCSFITFVCSVEAFIGVLYSGFCAAIFFGRVARIQSIAQVIFSDPIVVRYGTGLEEEENIHKERTSLMPSNSTFDRRERQRTLSAAASSDNSINNNNNSKIPCPVIEFVIVNSMFDEPGGEIIDASLNVVANVNALDADPVLINQRHNKRSKALRTYSYRMGPGAGGGENDSQRGSMEYSLSESPSEDSFEDSHSRGSIARRTSSHFLDSIMGRQHQTVDEDPSSSLVNKRIFSKMTIEACEHPFFKRVWVGRHVLDEDSPILRPRVKRMIIKNNGFWPERLNNYVSVRESLAFNQILVSLNGVSNLTASEVYAQKIYDFVDMNVGYMFVNTLYKDDDGILQVDTDLINDVRQQHGGGGEPLVLDDY